VPLPLLEYLTVFRSRVAVANVVLPIVGPTGMRSEAVLRKLREALSERVEIDTSDASSEPVLTYLLEKKLIGAKPRRTGRYIRYTLERDGRQWTARTSKGDAVIRLPVFRTDTWFSDGRLRSTVGLPTPDNSEEALEFCTSVDIVSKTRAARTSAGQLVRAARQLTAGDENPFVLCLESAALLRQLIVHDALALHELARQVEECDTSFRRDDLIPRFVPMARRMVEVARTLSSRPEDLAQVKEFLRLIDSTSRRKAGSDGPGVLEHRLSPRLEWLTDFGVLTKNGARNAFAYTQTPLVSHFADRLYEHLSKRVSADDVALNVSTHDPRWEQLRAPLRTDAYETALLLGYRALQARIGPVSIRDVCFLAAMHLDPIPATADLRQCLLQWAERDGGISLSGSRYRREPEMVHFSDRANP
jgi:hypothetical protein